MSNYWLDMWRRENANAAKAFPPAAKLLRNLRSIPGASNSAVVRLTELDVEEIAALAERGMLFPSGRGRFLWRRRDPSRCHWNVADLWRESRGHIMVATGLALADDGAWRSHSWGVRGKMVVETTNRFDAYYGVLLEYDEAERFALGDFVLR